MRRSAMVDDAADERDGGAAEEDAPPQREARIKDIATVEGIRDNQLVGYGIVVGLHGTGDSQQTGFSVQTLASMLLRMGVSVPATGIRVQNLAAVFVSATLPPFARPGAQIDITVSSAGDATSLEGGMLADDSALWRGRQDLRAGAGAVGGGRLLGQRERQHQAVQPSDDGADCRGSDGGARDCGSAGGTGERVAAVE